jgi:hypothetical protein
VLQHGCPVRLRPDYHALYYENLKCRSRRTFLFRDEYIFDLGSAIAAEVPEPGHATYLLRPYAQKLSRPSPPD